MAGAETPPTNDALFGALSDAVVSRGCIAIIGAGASAADYPVWPKLISILQERCGLRSEDSPSTDPLDVAQAAKDKNPEEYFAALDEIFAPRVNPQSTKRYHLLARIPFSSYVTVNFDPLLIDVLGIHRNVTVSEYPNLQNQHHGYGEIFYMHGRLGSDRPAAQADIVLTRNEFDRAYHPFSSRLHGFIQSTMLDNDVCFIGCNPAEPHLARLFDACRRFTEEMHGLTDPGRPRWFLLGDDQYDDTEVLRASGIRLVRYPSIDDQYSGMDSVLGHWSGTKPPIFRKAGVSQSLYRTDVEPDR